MIRKFAPVLAVLALALIVAIAATPFAIKKYGASKVDAALSRIGFQTTSMVRRGDVSVDFWSWTVSVASVEIIGAGGATRTEIGRLTIIRPSEGDGQMFADRMIADNVRVATPGETIAIPRAEIRNYAGPESGLTATPGLGRDARTQADLFEQLSIERIVAPVVTFQAAKSRLKRTISNLVVDGMRAGVIRSATADSIRLEAPYMPPTEESAPSSLLISTGAVRYDGLSLPTLWRFRDGDPDVERKSLLKAVAIADINLSLTMRPAGRFSASIGKIEAEAIGLRPLGFALSAFDPIATGMRYSSDATPQEVREQLAFAVALIRAASFERVRVTAARAQVTSAGEPQTVATLGSAEIGPYADAKIEGVNFAKFAFSGENGLKLSLDSGRAHGFDATGLVAYADRVARNEVLLTTSPTAKEMIKIIPRIKALDAQAFGLASADGSAKGDRARIDIDAPLDAAPQKVVFRLDGLDASPPAESTAQKWIERMELEGLTGSARFSLTLDPDKNVLSLDWLDYSFEKLGAVSASGTLEEVDPVLAVSSGAEFVDKFSAIRLAPFKLTLKDDGATDVLLRRAAARAGAEPDAFRAEVAQELETTIPRLLGPPAEPSGEAAAAFIRDPRSAEINLAPRNRGQTLLDLIRAAQLGPVGLAQVVDIQVLYRR